MLDNEKKLHTSLKKRFYETELEKTLIRFTRENNYKTLEQKKLAMKNLIKTLKEENKNLTDEDTIEIPFQKVKKKEKNEYIIDILKYLLKQEAFKDNVPENEYTDRLYEVDIPEDYEMLREEIKLKEQPKEIQDKINKLFYDVENNNKNKNIKQLLKNYSTQDLSKARERVKELKEQLKQEKKNNNNNNTILKLQKQIEEQQNFIKYFYSPLVISQRELKQKLKEFDINNRTGKEIYEFISNFLYNFYRYDTRKNTSRLFNDYGIKGIRYNGREDGECAVVFDDKAISIIERYNQINNKNSSRNPTNSLNNKTTANIIIQTKKSKVKNNILSRNIIQDIINNKNKYIDNNLLIDNRNIDFKHNKDIKHFVFGNSYNNRTRFGLLVRQAVIENLKNILPKTNLILTKQDNGKHSGIDDWNYYEAKNIEIDGNLYNVVFDTYTTPNNNSTSYLYDFKIFRADNNQILTQQNNKDQKGQITFLKNQAIITLFNGKADQSTILHELAHYYLETIRRFANKDNPLAQHILEEVKEWTTSEAEVDPTYFMHERFARSYEYYIRTGKFKGKDHSNFMIEIFEYFKKFLESIYKTLSELNLDNNKIDKVKMEKFFDEYLFNPENFKNNTDYNVNKNDINNTNNTKNNTDNKDLASLILNQTIIGEFNEDLDNRINEYVKELKAEGGYDPRDIEEIVKWRFEDEITMATEAEINGWNTKLDTEANNIKFAKNVIKIAKDVAQEVIEKDTNTKITRKEQGEAIYKPLKEKQSIEQQTEFQKRFNARFNEELETQLLNNKEDNPLYPTTKETDNTLDPTAERNYLTVGEREILNNIKNAMGKIYSKQWKEQTNYNNKVLKDVNDRRAKLSQIAEEEGYESMKLKPYRNIEEALADSEYSKLDYRDKLKANYKNSQEQDFGITGNDYGLTLEEYQNIIDFRKRFINNRIDAIIENYETAKRTIEKNKDEILRRKRFETLALERMDEAKKQLKENNNLIDNLNKDLKLDIKQYREVLDNIGFFNELETKRRIIDYSQNHNIEDIKQYIENERLKLVKKQLKEDIRSVLGGVMHISKRTGEVYNNILYEDTGLFNDLIKISEYSRKKAKVELIKLTKNNESLSENNNSIINPELLNRQNEVIEPIEVIDYFKDKETSKDITLKEVMEIIDSTVRKNENGVRILNNENTNEAVTLASKSIDKMISSTIAQTDNNIGGILGKTCIANIKNLFAKSTFIMETQDIKHNSKNKIRRYATAIKSRGETFIVKFTVKEITNGRKELTDIELQNNGGKDLSLYDLKVSKKEVAESTSSDKSEAISNDTITINNLIEFVKRDDEKYFKEMTSQGPRFREDDSSSDNQEPLSHTKLKQRLLYFMANDIIDTKETTDLLTKLGRLVKESKQKLQQLQDENKGKITEESKTLELAIKNNKLSKGKLNLNSLTQGYLGNLPTLFTYIANKEMANKFDYSEKEKMFDVNYQTKMNKLLGNMETIAGGENKAKELYKSWNETIIDKETGKPLKLILTTKDSQGELIHKTFEMKDSLDTLAKRLSDDLLEQTDKKAFVETSISFLDRIKNITPERGGGFKYKYELTKYEYDKLSNIIDNTTKEFKEDNKNIKLINDFKNSNVVKFDPIPPYEINTWNLMQFYLQSKNKQTRKLIEKYYSHYYQKLDDLVKQQDKEFFEVAELLFKAVQDINELNPYHMLVKNRPMGRVDNYFPRVSIHQDELSIFDMFNNETPREQQMTALNTRTFNAIPNLAVNPLVLASRHIMQTEYLKNIAVPLKKAILIVKKPSIQKAIEESKGIDIKNAVVEHLDELKYTYNQATVELDNMIRYFIGNWAKAKTNTLSVFLKQFTSFIPYMENIDNKKNYMKNFLLKGLIHPVDTFNWMMEHSPYARTRIEDKPFDYILEEIKNDKNREQPIIDFFKNFNDILRKYTGLDKIKITLPKLGDTLSVVYGGYARIQTLMQNGMTEEQAIKDFEKQTIETQQSEYSSLTPRSRLKHRVNSTPSKLAKMFTSQNAQYFQKFLQHYNNYFNGNIKKAEFYSYITLYHIILPLVMTVVNDTLIAGIFGKKDKNWWEHTKDFLGFTLLSFAPLDLLGQAVVLDSGKIIEKLFKKPYELFVDAGETITGLPISSYWRMFFKRYYKSIFDFYDTEETKKKKEKREENKKNKKE